MAIGPVKHRSLSEMGQGSQKDSAVTQYFKQVRGSYFSIQPFDAFEMGHPDFARSPLSYPKLGSAQRGKDFRDIGAPLEISSVPTIEILCSPTSSAFWDLQVAAMEGKIHLGRRFGPAISPPEEKAGFVDLLTDIAGGVAGVFVGAAVLLGRVIKPNFSQWHVTGEGPWQYAKIETHNSSHWIDRNGIEPVHGIMQEVEIIPSGEPCGKLEMAGWTTGSRIAIPSPRAEDASKYYFRSMNPKDKLLWDSSTGQYYLDLDPDHTFHSVELNVYRASDVQMNGRLAPAHFINNDPPPVVKPAKLLTRNSSFTRKWRQGRCRIR